HRRIDDPGSDLSNAGKAMSDPGIDHRWHVQTANLANVNARWSSSEIQGWQTKKRITGDGQRVHFAGIAQSIVWRATNKLHNRRCRSHRKRAYAAGFSDSAIPNVRVGV